MEDNFENLLGELGINDTVNSQSSIVEVKTEKRTYGKVYTVIEGLDFNQATMKKFVKQIKSKLGCGGTVKDGVISFQGDHVDKVKGELVKFGISEENVHTTRKAKKKR